jgi:hypothetical protein
VQDIRVIRKLEFTVGELRKINADYRKTVENRFIELFFDKLQSLRLSFLERIHNKSEDEKSRDYWSGYAQALNDIPTIYDKFATELDKEVKAG